MIADMLYGFLAPLMAVVISWSVVKRAYRANPAGLMPVLLVGMILKLMFFAAYAAVMLRVLHLQAVPFVATFTASFIVLHNIEALLMRRLFTSAC
jgi:hypothetical protein